MKNNGKLIAAVIAMLMVVCAVAVIATPAMAEDGDALVAPKVPTFNGAATATVGSVADVEALDYYNEETDILTVPSSGLVLTLTNDITIADMQILLNGNLRIIGGYTLTINHAVSDTGESIIYQGENVSAQVVVDGQGTELVTNISNASNYNPGEGSSNATLRVGGLFIINGGSVEINQPSTVKGQTWWTGEKYNLYMDNGSLDLNAAGLADVVLWMKNGSSLNVSNNQASTVTINNGSTIDDSEVTVSKPTNVDRANSSRIYISGTVNLTNSSIEMDGTAETVRDINFVAGATVNMDSTSSLTSPNFDMVDSSGESVTINGGTMNGQFIDAQNGSVKYALNGTTITGGAAPTAEILVGNDGVITKGNVDISAATVTGEGKIIVASGTANLPSTTSSSNVYVVSGSATIVASASGGSATTVGPSEGAISVGTAGGIQSAVDAGATDITTSNDITLDQNVDIGNASINLNGHSLIVNNKNFTFTVDGGSFNGKVKDANDSYNNFVTIELSGSFIISQGSIHIGGDGATYEDGILTVREGTVVVSGSLSGTLEIKADTGSNAPSASNTVDVIFQDFTVNAGATVKLLKNDYIDYYTEDTFSLYGNIIAEDDVTLYVGSDASITPAFGSQFTAYPGAVIEQTVTVVLGNTTTDSSINLDDSLKNMDISVDITGHPVYSQMQNITIVTSLNITSYSSLTIMGQLTINEGVTLTIQEHGELIIDSNTAKMIVDGTIEVENGGTITVLDADTVTVSGSITSEGSVEINSDVTVEEGGSIYIDDAEDSDFVVTEGLTVNANGSVEVRGEMAVDGIVNKGTITLNGATLVSRTVQVSNTQSVSITGCTISMAADGAVVDIRSFVSSTSANTLTITDAGLVLYDIRDDAVDVTVGGNKTYNGIANTYSTPNEIVFDDGQNMTGVRNVTITETVTSEREDNITTYYYGMNLSGSPAVVDDRTGNPTGAAKYTIGLAGVNFNVAAETTLTLGAGITLQIGETSGASGVLNVAGTLYAIAGGSTNPCAIENNGVVNVSGMIEAAEEDIEEGAVNAAKYEGEVEGNTRYYYTALATAIENGAEEIYVFGDIKILGNLTIPTGTTVRADDDATMTIGDSDHRDVVVDVEAGATVRGFTDGGSISVDGTLEFANAGDSRSNIIYSDVSVSADPAITYTNIYTALNNAESGETVTITRTTSPVFLNADITVDEGVTLVIPSNSTVRVNDGVTFTIDGTVQKIGAIVSEPNADGTDSDGFNPLNSDNTKKDADDYAVIIVNGALMSRGQQIDYASGETNVGYYIAGAYYRIIDSTGDWYYVTPVAQAAAVSNSVDEGSIKIYGDNEAGDVDFTGDEEQDVTITIMAGASLTAGSVSLSTATLDAKGGFTGTVDNAVGSIDLVNVFNYRIADTTDDDDNQILTFVDAPAKFDENGAESEVIISTGSVTVNANLSIDDYVTINDVQYTGVESFEISEGATLTVTGQSVKFYAEDLTVNGTLVSTDNGTVTVDMLTVRGTFTVAEADRENGIDAGNASIGILLVGITVDINEDDDVAYFSDATAASVNAADLGDFGAVIVSAQSTITGQAIENVDSTEFYLEDALWITVYSDNFTYASTAYDDSGRVAGVHYAIQPGDLSESEFIAWNGADGKNVPSGTAIGDVNYEQVYAEVNYDVYNVYVIVDNSIGSVAIDGQMLVETNSGYALPNGMKLDAGQHTVTYTLAAGYEGTATLTANGANLTVSGMTFTLSGDYQASNGQTINNYLTLGGATFSGSTVVIDGGNGGSSDMGLTDYLLIVLVILIVIMAIMVALRLMRS